MRPGAALSLCLADGGYMLIEVANWSEYNPRTDVKRSSWVRLNNDILTRMFRFTSDEKLVWIALICEASTKQSARVQVDIDLIATLLKVTTDSVRATLSKFEAAEMIKIHASRPRNVRVTSASRGRTADVPLRTDVRNVTNETDGTDVLTLPSTRTSLPKKRHPTHTEADLSVGREWLAFALQEMPWQAGRRGFSDESFAQAVAELRRATDLNPEGVAAVLAFVKADDFWRRNALSPAGLLRRSTKNGNRKIDNILVRMKTPTDRVLDSLKEWAEAT